MTFEEIWITSKSNDWSFFYPMVIVVGISVLTVLSFLRNRGVRIALKLISIFGFSCMGVVGSSLAIEEKWRIRGNWVKTHWESLTDAQRDIAQTDGANLVLGPIYYGFFAFVGFLVVALLLWVIFRKTRLMRLWTKTPPPGISTVCSKATD